MPLASGAVIEFDRFRLRPDQRLLEADGEPVRIGGRALDILIALVERPQEVVTHAELIRKAWPDAVVDPSSLRFHITALRKLLGDEGDGRFILNVQGRGYCFVATLKGPTPQIALAQKTPAAERAGRLPALPARMVRREEAAREIGALLKRERFLTLVGPGGIGKTTTALAAAHAMLLEETDVRFADLGALTQPAQVPHLLASIFGLLVHVEDPTPTLLAFLRDKQLTLILDSCEHVIDSAAHLAELVRQTAPHVSILATSREPLRVEGEHVVRVPPLACPDEATAVTAELAMTYGAVQLFLGRWKPGASTTDLSDADAVIVCDICRKLDGIALAIEIVAGQVDAFGLAGVAALLDDNLSLRLAGRRTALARHQTLNAMLAWSYALLTEHERRLLRRLSVFVGGFTLEMARTVAGDEGGDEFQFAESLAALVAKSLVTSEARPTGRICRLLETTRAYALDKLQGEGEFNRSAERHAWRILELLQQIARQAPALRQAQTYGSYTEQIGNVRAALKWCFSPEGDADLGVMLVAAASPLLVAASLVTECRDWTELALDALNERTRGTRHELELQFSIVQALLLTVGNPVRVAHAIRRGLELAELFEDPYEQLRFLGAEHIYRSRICEFRPALEAARKMEAIADRVPEPAARSIAAALLSISHHRAGELAEARRQCDHATSLLPLTQRIDLTKFGYDHRSRAVMASARTLWLLGCPDQAMSLASNP
jgi:predicted ATPase/DNA-binding winged helix-turn-helix (wHTH) protein